MKRRLAEVLLLCSAVTLLMGADTKEARFRRLGDKIMCSCGCAQMLLQCNHVGCPNSDRMIRELHALTGTTAGGQGGADSNAISGLQPIDNDEKVLEWFRQNWGITAVVVPRTYGFELFAWIIPFAVLAVGILMVLGIILWWHFRRVPTPPPPDPHTASFQSRVRRETEI